MARQWNETGPEFTLEWGGRTWTLAVDDPRPGLRVRDEGLGPLLGLEGIAAVGRWSPGALSGATLVGFERRLGRVEATYSPLGWGAASVRAAWSPSGDDGVDLEIQLSARSVGALKAVEIKLLSQLAEPTPSLWPTHRWVEPRDARSAGLSYDGREPDLRELTTLPLRDIHPRMIRGSQPDRPLYVEMVHPQDVTRRIAEGGRTLHLSKTTRYGLFGYDLERGVVLRARLRALWLPLEAGKRGALARFDQFLREPPPLST